MYQNEWFNKLLRQSIFIFVLFNATFARCPQVDENCDTCQDAYKIQKIGRLPDVVDESSGLAKVKNIVYTHNDSGGEPKLFALDPENKYALKEDISIPNAKNKDWEELAQKGDTIFIGDFGNNKNKRQNLRIYIYDSQKRQTQGEIKFYYPDQQAFPPEKKDRNFDCEAFFYARNNLYLFSKNRGSSDFVKIYRLPAYAGNYEAQLLDSIQVKGQVTAADISPDGKMIALLTYGMVLFYQVDFDEQNIPTLRADGCCRFLRAEQSEAILFLDNHNLLITNEQGNIFTMFRG
ncbi:MAG: hypothetical protein JJT94_11865 [Bernardetiaceae bacterium]|nr:hypothetical protein [Bernardetiaceae bacterium]